MEFIISIILTGFSLALCKMKTDRPSEATMSFVYTTSLDQFHLESTECVLP